MNIKKILILLYALCFFSQIAEAQYRTPLASPVVTSVSRDNPTTADETNTVLHLSPGFTGNANDLSGEGNDGTLAGGASIVSGGVEFVNSLDSTKLNEDRITTTLSGDLGTGDFFISLWVNPDYVNHNMGFMSCAYYNGTRYGWWCGINTGGTMVLYNYGNSANASVLISSGSINANEWSHLIITRVSGTVSMYINGFLSGSIYYNNTIDDDANRNLGFGYFTEDASDRQSYCYDGTMDELKFSNSAGLSASQALAEYNSGKWRITGTGNKQALRLPMSYTGDRYSLQSDRSNMVLYLPMGRTRDANDISGNGNDGTLQNGAIINSQGVNLNGTTQYLSSGDISTYSFVQNTGVYTLSAWIKLDVVNDDGVERIILANTPLSTEKGFYFEYLDGYGLGNNALRIRILNGIGAILDHIVDDVIDTAEIWYHCVAVGNGTNNILYINGLSAGTSSNFGTLSTGNSSRIMNIGRYPYTTPGGYFDGIIDDVKILSVAWTATQVQQEYNSGKWRIDGTRLIDISATKQACSLQGDAIITSNGLELSGNSGCYAPCGDLGTSVQSLGLWVNVADTNKINILSENSSSAGIVTDADGILSYSLWDNCFVDGVDTDTITIGWHHILLTSTTGVDCSAMNLGKIDTSYMTGYIDDVIAYNRELSTSEGIQIYNWQKPRHQNPAPTAVEMTVSSGSGLDPVIAASGGTITWLWPDGSTTSTGTTPSPTLTQVGKYQISSTDFSLITEVQFTGDNITALDNLNLLPNLTRVYVNTNTVLSAIDVTTNLDLEYFYANGCSLSTVDLSNNALLSRVYLQDNGFSESAVNTILQDIDAHGTSSGTLNISGTNAAPTGAGLTAASNLSGRGWTVTVTT